MLRPSGCVTAVRAVDYQLPYDARRDARLAAVDWLTPAPVAGYAIASFCGLDLRDVRLTRACAPRLNSVNRPPRLAVQRLGEAGASPF